VKLAMEMRTENVDFARYHAVYFSEEFNLLAMGAAKLKRREMRRQETLPDGRESRSVRMVPDVALPGVIAKLTAGRDIEYRENTVFDPKTRTARIDIKSIAGDLVKVGGDVRFVEERGGITLHFDGEVRIRVFGIGGLIEKFIVAQVRERYAAVSKVLQQYLDDDRRAA
jgi:hypothetical protein